MGRESRSAGGAVDSGGPERQNDGTERSETTTVGNGVNLFQFIVPLAFLAIWALTFLINREAQPLPPRAGRPAGPPSPPRPRAPGGAPSTARAAERRNEPFARDGSGRWSTTAGGSPSRTVAGRPGGGASENEIVILESETRRPSGTAGGRPESGSGHRRGTRARAAAAAAGKRSEPATPRALSAAMGQDASGLNSPQNRELTPLTRTVLPLSTQVSHEAPGLSQGGSQATPFSPLTNPEFTQLLKNPAKLREAIVLNELLQPPLALRGLRSRRD